MPSRPTTATSGRALDRADRKQALAGPARPPRPSRAPYAAAQEPRERGRSSASATSAQAVMQIAAARSARTVAAARVAHPHDPVLQPAGLDRAGVPGPRRPRSARSSSSPRRTRSTSATLLDEDARVVVTTEGGQQLWAAYPSSDAQTNNLLRTLRRGRRDRRRQAAALEARAPDRRAVPDADPDPRLPVRVLHADRPGRRVRAASRPSRSSATAARSARRARAGHLRRRRGRGRGGRGAARDPRLPGRPEPVRDDGRAGAPRSAAGRPAGHRQDADRARRRRARPPPRSSPSRARSSSSRWSASGAARVRDLFERARKAAPAIVFIDELDAAGRRRGAGVGQGNDEREQTLNQLLVEMDGFDADSGIVVMGATNRPDILDPALLRPGPLRPPGDDRRAGRARALRDPGAALRRRGRWPPDASLMDIAKLTPGFSGAELANVINEAALLTVREGAPGDPRSARSRRRSTASSPGPAKKSHVLTKAERWIIAVHEASHAVVTRAIGQTVSVQKLSIVARGRHDGDGRAHARRPRSGGRAGAGPPAPAGLDRRRAPPASGSSTGSCPPACTTTCTRPRNLARRMVTSFGMSETRSGP